jgi:hypothetical protein
MNELDDLEDLGTDGRNIEMIAKRMGRHELDSSGSGY